MFKQYSYTLSLVSFFLILSYLHACAMKLTIGSSAPDFELYDENNHAHRLSTTRGKKVALVFYPLNQTSHCTKELCSIRDDFADLQAAGIVVLGINPGTAQAHQIFKSKHHFPFPLLSDVNKKVSKLYGAKRPFGLPIRRITVLINEEGIIVAILQNITIADHAREIIQAFQSL